MNDRSNLGEVTYEYTYDAPRELLFECMTTAEHLSKFWGPIGMSTPVESIVVEPRAGGRFETVMVDDATGAQYPTKAVFVEVTAPERIVFTEPDVEGGMTTAIHFNDLGDGRTHVVSHQTNVPEMFRSPEAQEGMKTSFDKLNEYAKSIVASRGAPHLVVLGRALAKDRPWRDRERGWGVT
jgi:uncharacterized protein YndB with AHSA1/START domain